MVSKECLEEIEYYSKHPWNEKTAKDMFEELGYELIIDSEANVVYYYKDDEDLHINFLKKYKVIYGTPTYDYFCDMGILKAINKQVEELGW